MEFNIGCIEKWTSNNNIMQLHSNNVGSVPMSTHYSYTEHRCNA